MSASLPFRRLARRWAGLLAVLAVAGTLSVSTALPAQAAQCAAEPAHVYITGGQQLVSFPGNIFKFENDPIDGPLQSLTVFASGSIRLGGNGLEPGTRPVWNVFRESTGGPWVRYLGSTVGGNCVSNERFFPIGSASTGDSYIYRVDYTAGNSNRIVTGQAHFRVVVP